MWYISFPEHFPYRRCHSSGDCCPSLKWFQVLRWTIQKNTFICFNSPLFTYCPRLVCRSKVTRVEAPGQVQLFANNAYLNSSSQTTNSANFTCNLFSGLNIWTYCGTAGAKSFTAHDLVLKIFLLNKSLSIVMHSYKFFGINLYATLVVNKRPYIQIWWLTAAAYKFDLKWFDTPQTFYRLRYQII